MAGKFKYGVLRGIVAGHLRDADDDHYQILVNAEGAMHRIAVNVHSSVQPPDLRFQSTTTLPKALKDTLGNAKVGFTGVKSEPGGIAQDYVRGGIVDVNEFKIVPGDKPGAKNDLKDTLEDAVIAAIDEHGSEVFAIGAKWGPEDKKDKYFKFLPGNGIHNIHMNQGNDPSHAGDDGVYHDGCLIFRSAGNKWLAFYFAFQSQTFETDDKTGHAVGGSTATTRTSRAGSGNRKTAKKHTPAKKTQRSKAAKKTKKTKKPKKVQRTRRTR